MKKIFRTLLLLAALAAVPIPSAMAAEGNSIRVGLRYGSSAMYAANLENVAGRGSGYRFGRFDQNRNFVPLGETGETAITMVAASNINMKDSGGYAAAPVADGEGGYHVERDGYRDFETAREDAETYGGWPVFTDGGYAVRTGVYDSRREAEEIAGYIDGETVRSSAGSIVVTATGTNRVLFEYDGGPKDTLAVFPRGGDPQTWFRGYRYEGGFEYVRRNGGNLTVINVLNMEDYVKGVIPYEMSGRWPLQALEAQAVCARSFAKGSGRHQGADGFDVCNTQHCQVYYGTNAATDRSDQAVDNTVGKCLYYHNKLVATAVYHSSDGGATEDAKAVWGGGQPYLIGKPDPYEAKTTIPNYHWSVTYTASELSWILQQKGHPVGQVQNVFVSKRTPNGNVLEVTFVGDKKTLRVSGERCRTIFYSSTYHKSVKSQRFQISGGAGASGGKLCINNSQTTVNSLNGLSAVTGSGQVVHLPGGQAAVMTGNGLQITGGTVTQTPTGSFTITGTGYGHNVGMSQYGAKAMAELGFRYQDILNFYYTDITIR